MKHLGKFIFVFLWLTLCMPLVLVGTVAAQSQFEVVHFSAKARPGVQQANLSDGQPSGTPIWGHISRPSGPGPHPAIVLLHGCGGILQSHFDWAVHLNRSGYVTLIVDSFRPRSLISDCSGGSGTASPSGRVLDAYGALDYLMSRYRYRPATSSNPATVAEAVEPHRPPDGFLMHMVRWIT